MSKNSLGKQVRDATPRLPPESAGGRSASLYAAA
jgi:hypothetical protein